MMKANPQVHNSPNAGAPGWFSRLDSRVWICGFLGTSPPISAANAAEYAATVLATRRESSNEAPPAPAPVLSTYSSGQIDRRNVGCELYNPKFHSRIVDTFACHSRKEAHVQSIT